MQPRVNIGRFSCTPFTNVNEYRRLVGDELMDDIERLARALPGVRICHVSSTGFGGGVAELLARHVPLACALGIDSDWRVMQGTPAFFAVTKAMHNALQGAVCELSEVDKAVYLHVNHESAKRLEESYDVFIVHDPQPAAFLDAVGHRGAKWIWRCHIDTSVPNAEIAGFLLPYLEAYDAVIFTMEQFALPGLHPSQVAFIAPAIDPLSTKNMQLPMDLCRDVLANAGIDTSRPLVVQVSRFDPWKDPLGVIEAYRLARESVSGLQLALVGALAGDDPEGWALLSTVQEAVAQDRDIHVFTNLAGVGSMEVNAFQRASDLVVQKSLREGFGLVVSEAFWKGKAMVAGRAGGIPMQFPPSYDRYLVTTLDECAARMVELLESPATSGVFGEAAHDHVRRNFLLPRLLRDELRLVESVLRGTRHEVAQDRSGRNEGARGAWGR